MQPELQVRKSSKSLQAHARFHQLRLPPDAKFSPEAEYSWSTQALLTLLLSWACVSSRTEGEVAYAAEKAKLLLSVFVDMSVGLGTFEWSGVDGHYAIKIEGGRVLLRELLAGTVLNRVGLANTDPSW